jgi:alkaline phosphatase
MSKRFNISTCLFVVSFLLVACQPVFGGTKNIILMISDGQGFNTVKATNYYTGTQAVYESFPVKYGMQTNSANNPAGYSPTGMATDFNYAKNGATDSASSATAMYSGVKNYDGQINWSKAGLPLTTFFETAALAGKSIGAVSSVQLSHATPAAVYAHNSSRNNYIQIANEGIYGAYNENFKVLMGAGHPDWDKNNQYNTTVTNKYVGGTATWTDITDGSVPNGWSLVESKAQFQSLMAGPTPDKVLGVAKVNSTLQNDRTMPPKAADPTNPSGVAYNSDVPTLQEMTKSALNVLDNNSNGFVVMIEGGAVDWANHANNLAHMIEEQIDFNNAVQVAVEWVNTNSSWDETLLIVTADHECGHLWGPAGPLYIDNNTNGTYDSGIDTFQGYDQLVNNGAGNLPGAGHFSADHTNALVPLYAQGAGSDLFMSYVIGMDSNLTTMYGLDGSWTGEYIDNTAIFNVVKEVGEIDICECDLNDDGNCDMLDWLVFGVDWGRTDCNEPDVEPCECDINSDGNCDMLDWLEFGVDWGRTDCPVF